MSTFKVILVASLGYVAIKRFRESETYREMKASFKSGWDAGVAAREAAYAKNEEEA